MKFKSRTRGEVVRLASTSGHICLIGDEFSEVPEHMESEAYAKGCVSEALYQSIKEDMKKDAKDAKEADAALALNGGGTPAGADQSPVIIAKLNEMMDSTEDGYFTQGGLPNLKILGTMCGFKVSKEEMEKCWAIVSADKAGSGSGE